MYKVLTFLILLIAPVDVLSQVTTQLEIVDDSLGRGENFRFTFSLHYGSDETLEYAGSSSWQVKHPLLNSTFHRENSIGRFMMAATLFTPHTWALKILFV